MPSCEMLSHPKTCVKRDFWKKKWCKKTSFWLILYINYICALESERKKVFRNKPDIVTAGMVAFVGAPENITTIIISTWGISDISDLWFSIWYVIVGVSKGGKNLKFPFSKLFFLYNPSLHRCRAEKGWNSRFSQTIHETSSPDI